jgi:beta-1,4-mannosyltransferase
MFFLFAICKIFFQLCQLFWTLLFVTPRAQYLLVQNPPAMPTLFVVQIVCWLRCTRLVIDWHNFGYTILGARVLLFYVLFDLIFCDLLIYLWLSQD